MEVLNLHDVELGNKRVYHLTVLADKSGVLEFSTEVKFSLDFELFLEDCVDPVLIHVGSHRAAGFVLETLVFEVELHFVLTVICLNDIEVNLDSSLRNRFDLFRLTEFNLITENVSHLVEEENLDDVDFTPVIYDILDN